MSDSLIISGKKPKLVLNIPDENVEIRFKDPYVFHYEKEEPCPLTLEQRGDCFTIVVDNVSDELSDKLTKTIYEFLEKKNKVIKNDKKRKT